MRAVDEVEVEGFFNPPDETKVKAQRITITSDRVIGEAPARKQRVKRVRGAKPQSEPQDPADPADPAPEKP